MIPSTSRESLSRRSSILKPPKARQPLQNVDFKGSSEESTPNTAKFKRRVSFAEKKHVKEFCDSLEQGTVWDNTYEENDVSANKIINSIQQENDPQIIHRQNVEYSENNTSESRRNNKRNIIETMDHANTLSQVHDDVNNTSIPIDLNYTIPGLKNKFVNPLMQELNQTSSLTKRLRLAENEDKTKKELRNLTMEFTGTTLKQKETASNTLEDKNYVSANVLKGSSTSHEKNCDLEITETVDQTSALLKMCNNIENLNIPPRNNSTPLILKHKSITSILNNTPNSAKKLQYNNHNKSQKNDESLLNTDKNITIMDNISMDMTIEDDMNPFINKISINKSLSMNRIPSTSSGLLQEPKEYLETNQNSTFHNKSVNRVDVAPNIAVLSENLKVTEEKANISPDTSADITGIIPMKNFFIHRTIIFHDTSVEKTETFPSMPVEETRTGLDLKQTVNNDKTQKYHNPFIREIENFVTEKTEVSHDTSMEETEVIGNLQQNFVTEKTEIFHDESIEETGIVSSLKQNLYTDKTQKFCNMSMEETEVVCNPKQNIITEKTEIFHNMPVEETEVISNLKQNLYTDKTQRFHNMSMEETEVVCNPGQNFVTQRTEVFHNMPIEETEIVSSLRQNLYTDKTQRFHNMPIEETEIVSSLKQKLYTDKTQRFHNMSMEETEVVCNPGQNFVTERTEVFHNMPIEETEIVSNLRQNLHTDKTQRFHNMPIEETEIVSSLKQKLYTDKTQRFHNMSMEETEVVSNSGQNFITERTEVFHNMPIEETETVSSLKQNLDTDKTQRFHNMPVEETEVISNLKQNLYTDKTQRFHNMSMEETEVVCNPRQNLITERTEVFYNMPIEETEIVPSLKQNLDTDKNQKFCNMPVEERERTSNRRQTYVIEKTKIFQDVTMEETDIVSSLKQKLENVKTQKFHNKPMEEAGIISNRRQTYVIERTKNVHDATIEEAETVSSLKENVNIDDKTKKLHNTSVEETKAIVDSRRNFITERTEVFQNMPVEETKVVSNFRQSFVSDRIQNNLSNTSAEKSEVIPEFNLRSRQSPEEENDFQNVSMEETGIITSALPQNRPEVMQKFHNDCTKKTEKIVPSIQIVNNQSLHLSDSKIATMLQERDQVEVMKSLSLSKGKKSHDFGQYRVQNSSSSGTSRIAGSDAPVEWNSENENYKISNYQDKMRYRADIPNEGKLKEMEFNEESFTEEIVDENKENRIPSPSEIPHHSAHRSLFLDDDVLAVPLEDEQAPSFMYSDSISMASSGIENTKDKYLNTPDKSNFMIYCDLKDENTGNQNNEKIDIRKPEAFGTEKCNLTNSNLKEVENVEELTMTRKNERIVESEGKEGQRREEAKVFEQLEELKENNRMNEERPRYIEEPSILKEDFDDACFEKSMDYSTEERSLKSIGHFSGENRIIPVKSIETRRPAPLSEIRISPIKNLMDTSIPQDPFISLVNDMNSQALSDDIIWELYHESIEKSLLVFGFIGSSLLVATYLKENGNDLNSSKQAFLVKEIKVVSRLADDADLLLKLVHRLLMEKINTEKILQECKNSIPLMLNYFTQEVKLAMDFMFDLERLDDVNLMDIDLEKISFIAKSQTLDTVLRVTMLIKPFDQITPNDISISCLSGTVREKDIRELITNIKKDHRFLRGYMNDIRDYIDLTEVPKRSYR